MQTLTKQQIIKNLYNQLNKSGQRGDTITFISELCDVKWVTVRNSWMNQFPDYLTDEVYDKIIAYLEPIVAENNKEVA